MNKFEKQIRFAILSFILAAASALASNILRNAGYGNEWVISAIGVGLVFTVLGIAVSIHAAKEYIREEEFSFFAQNEEEDEDEE